jgi:Suppressor of fused protein (SUFU)
MVIGAVRDLYIARWGEPSRNARFQVDGFEVEIFKWSAEVNREGVNLYVTTGASARPLAGRDTGHRVEFFTGLLPARDEIASPLAALALRSAREGVALDHGHTVPAGGPLWPGTDMRWFLVLRPVGDIIAPLELLDGVHVDFLQAIPIFESELAYKAEHGAEALLALWEAKQVPFWDSGRSPVPM